MTLPAADPPPTPPRRLPPPGIPLTQVPAPTGEQLPSGLLLGPRCPPRLAELLRAGQPILLQARVSNPSGTATYDAVAQNAHIAAHEAAQGGLFPNLPALLPSKDDLAASLHQSGDIQRSQDADGYEFENRFVVVQSPRCPTVWLHLSCGSGKKIDDATLHQPVALHSAALVSRLRPPVVLAAEVSRWTRKTMALLPWIDALERLEPDLGGPPYICRKHGEPEELTTAVVVSLANDAAIAQEEARAMRARTARALRDRAPFPAENGVAPYPFSQPPPPPLATAWRSEGSAGRGHQIVFLDVPEVRAALTGVTYGLPEVFEADGVTPVDQLTPVRFFLAHRGDPDWPARRLVEHLVDLGYSTEGLRRQRGSRAARWADRPLDKNDIWRIIDGLETHLDFYRTGDLFRGVGDRGEPVLATHLTPPDGDGYLTDADYDRIRDMQRDNQVAASRAHRWTFGHLPVIFRGVPARLIVTADHDTVTYRVRRLTDHRAPDSARALLDGAPDSPDPVDRVPARPTQRPPGPGPGRPSPTTPRIPATAFATSLLEGLRDHAGHLTGFVPAIEDGPTEAELHRDALADGLVRKRKVLDAHYRRLFPADGNSRVTDQALDRANADYNRLDAEIRSDAAALTEATILAERARAERHPRTLEIQELIKVLVSLRDPEDVTYQPQWHRSITALAVDSHVGSRPDVITTEWAGTLLLTQGEDCVVVPFAGTADRAWGRGSARAARLVARLRAGHPLPGGPLSTQSPWLQTQLRQALAVPTGPVPLLTVRDPRLLRIGMAVLYPPSPESVERGSADAGPARDVAPAGPPLNPRQLPAAARRLGVPLDLAKRVVAVTGHHTVLPGAQRQWNTVGDHVVADLCTAIQRHHGTLASRDYPGDRWADLRHAALRCPLAAFCELPRGAIVLEPCPWCGATAPLILTIREATEPVCGSCRRDRTGIDWPAKPYDRYRSRPRR